MNELIEELFEEHARLFMNDKCEMLFTDFAQAIQTACKAQRNACKRVYDVEYAKSPDYFGDYVLKAEIKKEDYE